MFFIIKLSKQTGGRKDDEKKNDSYRYNNFYADGTECFSRRGISLRVRRSSDGEGGIIKHGNGLLWRRDR